MLYTYTIYSKPFPGIFTLKVKHTQLNDRPDNAELPFHMRIHIGEYVALNIVFEIQKCPKTISSCCATNIEKKKNVPHHNHHLDIVLGCERFQCDRPYSIYAQIVNREK